MKKIVLLSLYFSILFFSCFNTYAQDNYLDYHKEIIYCEELISKYKFSEAVVHFETLFQQYEFVFLRDCKLATELSAYLGNSKLVSKFIRYGIQSGWTLKRISEITRLTAYRDNAEWDQIKTEYDSLHKKYKSRLNDSLRDEVSEMYKKDQKMALKAFLRIREKARVKYAENKFAPHSEKQLETMFEIVNKIGYPGEKRIGNDFWVLVILSHHNSISKNYNRMDTLYTSLKPYLMHSIKTGEISPYELSVIQDWRTAALSDHGNTSFGFLGRISNEADLEMVNNNRALIGMRSIQLRNGLIEIENKTGLNLYLPKGWQKGKIEQAK